MTYDEYGRLQLNHAPEQFEGSTIKYLTYAYNTDDTLKSVTDAREATTTFGYNSRHLLTSAVSTLENSPTTNVTYGYDSAGNRTSISHLVGGVAQDDTSYSYDQLSRLTAETIHINALQSYYTIGYGYTLSNQLSSVVDPFGSPTTISYDQIGRTATVTGTWNGTNYTYANNVSYRAWGGVKSVSFNGQTKATTYNSRMLPTHYSAYDYSYYDDGKLQEFRDQNDQVGNPQYVQFHYMSRRYSYDHAGRVTAVGQLQNYSIMAPFSGTYGYDAFDNLNSRSGQYALNPSQSDSGTYTNNRRGGWIYDAEGKVTISTDNSDSGGSSSRAWTYDSAGQLIVTSEVRNGQTTTLATGYDGDGKVIHEVINGTTGDYVIQSSVLGTVLTKLKLNGGKDITYVPANGLVFPMQMQDQPYSSPPSWMSWVSRDPLGIQEDKNGYLSAYDPFGTLVANVQPPSGGPPPYMPVYGATYGGVSWNSFINANNFSGGCIIDGRPADCNKLKQSYEDGWLNYDRQSGLTDSTKYVPHDPPGFFVIRGEYGNSGHFVTGPVFSGAEPQTPAPTPTPTNPRQNFKNFLQTMSQDCKHALKNAGLLGTVTNLANTASVYDVNSIQNSRASTYVDGAAKPRETVGQWFDRQGHNAVTAVRVPRTGIYIRGGEAAFGSPYLELHEFTHLAYPSGRDLDASLATKLGLTKAKNENWSAAVSRFFNSQCTRKTP
jgi:YD repeat-containing protein